MNRQHRESFLMAATRMGLNDYQAKRITRLAATYDRLAEAECNGDWPCDNGVREVIFCGRCGSGYVKSYTYLSPRDALTDNRGEVIAETNGRICKSCRTKDNISALCEEYGIAVEFQGDPRGWTVKLSKLESVAC